MYAVYMRYVFVQSHKEIVVICKMAKCYAVDVHSVRAHTSVELIDIDRTTKYMNVK